jgi:hypothetical protein
MEHQGCGNQRLLAGIPVDTSQVSLFWRWNHPASVAPNLEWTESILTRQFQADGVIGSQAIDRLGYRRHP